LLAASDIRGVGKKSVLAFEAAVEGTNRDADALAQILDRELTRATALRATSRRPASQPTRPWSSWAAALLAAFGKMPGRSRTGKPILSNAKSNRHAIIQICIDDYIIVVPIFTSTNKKTTRHREKANRKIMSDLPRLQHRALASGIQRESGSNVDKSPKLKLPCRSGQVPGPRPPANRWRPELYSSSMNSAMRMEIGDRHGGRAGLEGQRAWLAQTNCPEIAIEVDRGIVRLPPPQPMTSPNKNPSEMNQRILPPNVRSPPASCPNTSARHTPIGFTISTIPIRAGPKIRFFPNLGRVAGGMPRGSHQALFLSPAATYLPTTYEAVKQIRLRQTEHFFVTPRVIVARRSGPKTTTANPRRRNHL